MRLIIDRAPALAQFPQCVRPEAAEYKQPAGFQHPPQLGKKRVRGRAPGQHDVAEHQIDRLIRERQRQRVGAYKMIPRKKAGRLAAGLAQHIFSQIQLQHTGLFEAPLKPPRAVTRAGTQIKAPRGPDPERLERLQQAIRDRPVQEGGGVVMPGRGVKGTPRPGRADGIGPVFWLSHVKVPQSGARAEYKTARRK